MQSLHRRSTIFTFFTMMLACFASIGGCSTVGTPHTAVLAGSALPIFDGNSGLAMTWDGLVASAASADAVLIGEMHGHTQGLTATADLFDAILARRPNSAALALEFMERDDQVALDDYLSGVTDTEAFEKAIGAGNGNHPSGHRRMVEAAKAANRPVYAANAPRRYVRLARTDGFERLYEMTPEQQRLLSVPDAILEGPYKDHFFELMEGMSASHGDEGDADTEPEDNTELIMGMFRSQNVWDATMADSVARAISHGNGPVVLVVGQFHVDFNGGLVERLRALRPGVRILTISLQDAQGSTFREDDRNRADAVIHVGP